MRKGLPILSLAVGELPLGPDAADDAPFLRPKERMKPRRRRGPLGRTVVVLRLLAVLVMIVAAAWTAYARTMRSERLKVSRVEVRGSRFLSEGEVR